MKDNLKKQFPELTEDSLTAIEEAVNTKVELAVEAALTQQDDVYSDKLKELIKVIDQDRSAKLKRVVESVDKANTSKLLKVVKRYEIKQLEEAKKFKKSLISTINAFLDEEVISSVISEQDFSKAVKNVTAYNVLNNLRKALSVDSVMMKESVQEAFLDGKDQLEKKDKQIKSLQNESNTLKGELEDMKKTVFIMEKTANFPENKRNFINKTFSDKPLTYLEENFDYVSKIFDKNEQKQLKVIKEQALDKRKTKVDYVKVEKIVEEKVNNSNETDPYLAELEKVRKY